MKHLKTYERKINSYKIGDYVLIKKRYIDANIEKKGKISHYLKNNKFPYTVKLYNNNFLYVKEIEIERYLTLEEIEEYEIKKASEKYNL